jgi:hypothetical protein
LPRSGNFGGWSLYAHDGKLRYHYNFLGLLQFDVTSAGKLSPGELGADCRVSHRRRISFGHGRLERHP